jgi:hypothetical protein
MLVVLENLICTKIMVLRDLLPCIIVVDTIYKEHPVVYVDVRVLPWRWN